MRTTTRRSVLGAAAGAATLSIPLSLHAQSSPPAGRVQSWPPITTRSTGIHDIAPAPDGGVWFSAQGSGHLGYFDPKTGKTELIPLGPRSSPHGVIQGPDKAAWLTDGGPNAIVRVSWI